MGRNLAPVAVIAVACSPTTTESPPADSSSGTGSEVSGASTSAQPCFFEERPTEPDDYNPACDGLAEDACEAAAACQTIRGRAIDVCTTDAIECEAAGTYLGCAGLVVCKSEVGFFCAPDLSTTYVAERRCNPPQGWVQCEPDLDELALEGVASAAIANCF